MFGVIYSCVSLLFTVSLLAVGNLVFTPILFKDWASETWLTLWPVAVLVLYLTERGIKEAFSLEGTKQVFRIKTSIYMTTFAVAWMITIGEILLILQTEKILSPMFFIAMTKGMYLMGSSMFILKELITKFIDEEEKKERSPV